MNRLPRSTPRKGILLRMGVAAVASLALVGGAVAALTDRGLLPDRLTAGTVELSVAAAGGSTTWQTGLPAGAPGDTVPFYLNLQNSGSLPITALTMRLDHNNSKLMTTYEGVQVKVEQCSQAWTQTGGGSCGGTRSTLVGQKAVRDWWNTVPLPNTRLEPGQAAHLLATFTLPREMGNDFQGVADSLSLTFAGAQDGAEATLPLEGNLFGSGYAPDSRLGNFVLDNNTLYEGRPTWRAEGAYYVSEGDRVKVDVGRRYRVSYTAKGERGTMMFAGFAPYDVGGHAIRPLNYMYWEGSTTKLARDLKPGDTKIYLESAAGWPSTAPEYHNRSIIFWEWEDETGFKWPAGTYSRYNYMPIEGVWPVGGVNMADNSLTLTHPWPYRNPKRQDGVWPAGTELGAGSSGGTFLYTAASSAIVSPTWQTYTGEIQGVQDQKGGPMAAGLKFPAGTDSVAPMILANYNYTAADPKGPLWIGKMSLEVVGE